MPKKGGLLMKIISRVVGQMAKKNTMRNRNKGKGKRKINKVHKKEGQAAEGDDKEESDNDDDDDDDDDDDGVDELDPIAKRATKRPSMQIKSKLRFSANEPLRPPIAMEYPCLFRLYKGTFQIVDLSLKSLNSQSAFILICDKDRRVVNWVGNQCDENDLNEADKLRLTVLKREYGMSSKKRTSTVYEDSEDDNAKLFSYFLGFLPDATEALYLSKKVKYNRSTAISNAKVVVSTISRSSTLNFSLHEKGVYLPDEEGYISRVEFPTVHLSTIATLNMGNQWYMWIARGVPAQDEQAAKAFLIADVSRRLRIDDSKDKDVGLLANLGDLAFSANDDSERENDLLGTNIRIVRQGAERTLFRRFFKIFTEYEPRDRTAPYIPVAEDYPSSAGFSTDDGSANVAAKESGDPNKGLVPHLYDTLGFSLLPDLVPAKNTATSEGFELWGAANSFDPLPASVAGKRTDDRVLESLRWLSSDVDSKSQSQSQSEFQSESALSQAQLGESTPALKREGSNVSEAHGITADGLVRTGSAASTGSLRRSGSTSGHSVGSAGASVRSGSVNSLLGDRAVSTRSSTGGAQRISQSSGNGLSLQKSGSVASNTSHLSQRMNTVRAENEKSSKEEGFFGVTIKDGGRDLIDAADLEFLEFDNVTPQARNNIIARAEQKPRTLVGWQIEIDDGPLAGINVVTAIKKNFGFSTQFCLTSYSHPDTWVTLRRGKKDGLPFRPLRSLGWA